MEHVLIFCKIIGSLWDKQVWFDTGLCEDMMVQWLVQYLLVCLNIRNLNL